MSENLSIEAPEFDTIKKEAGQATRDGVQLLWTVANEEARQRRRGVRLSTEVSRRKVVDDAPTTQQNDYDWKDAGILVFTGSTSFTLTGLRNGVQGAKVEIHNLGTGTITLAHESASSEAANRLDTAGDASVSVATGNTAVLRYLNSRWRQDVPVSAVATSGTWSGIYLPTALDVTNAPTTWVNQGTATISTSSGPHVLVNGGGFANVAIRDAAAPATPYTITVVCTRGLWTTPAQCHVGFRDSSTGRLHSLSIEANGNITYQKWNSATSYNSDYGIAGSVFPNYFCGYYPVFVQISDNGTNRILRVSPDYGLTWRDVHTISRTDFVATPDRVYYGVNNAGASGTSSMGILSWVIS